MSPAIHQILLAVFELLQHPVLLHNLLVFLGELAHLFLLLLLSQLLLLGLAARVDDGLK